MAIRSSKTKQSTKHQNTLSCHKAITTTTQNSVWTPDLGHNNLLCCRHLNVLIRPCPWLIKYIIWEGGLTVLTVYCQIFSTNLKWDMSGTSRISDCWHIPEKLYFISICEKNVTSCISSLLLHFFIGWSCVFICELRYN